MRYFTNSELGTIRRCPRQWYFEYYLSIKKTYDTKNLAVTSGIYLHEGVAEYYNDGQDPLSTVALLAATDRAEQETILETAGENAQIKVEENLKIIKQAEELSTIMIQGYLEWLEQEGADSYLMFISAEEEVSILFPSEQIQAMKPTSLLGKLDAKFLDERTGARVFMDHKSVQNFSDREKTAHLDPQFLFYSLIEYLTLTVEQEEGTTEVAWTDGGIINMARRVKRTGTAKPPFFKRKDVGHSIHELRNFFVRTAGEILRALQMEDQLDAGLDHRMACPPSPTRDCSWDCQYLQLCTIVDDGSDASGFIEDVFTVVDPLERYATIEDAD